MLRKHLLYLSSEQLWAYRWRNGALSTPQRFSPDRAGVDAFMDYIAAHGAHPAYLLADLIEEDFQRIQMPHVGGRAGRRLAHRRLLQQYRETPYRHLSIQGRAPDGRRDDIALLCALTNPAAVQPWVQALELLKVPLAGLYSATLVSAALLRRLQLRAPHLLLLTEQSAGLRQSYYQEGQLKFSRLTLAIDRDGAPLQLARETDKTQQFLTSVRLLGRGESLDVVVLAPAAQLGRLGAACVDGPETRYQFVAMETAAQEAGMTEAPALADTVLLQLLAEDAPSSHYTLGLARRYYQLWRARLYLYTASVGFAVIGLGWVGGNLWHYVDDNRHAEHMYAETELYDSRYRAVMSDMPPGVAKTANMKAAVTVARLIARQAPGPQPLMTVLSQALDKVPQIRLTALDWKTDLPGVKDGVSTPQNSGDAAPAEPLTSRLIGIPTRPPQSLRVEAEIAVSEDNYHAVVDAMNQFTQELASRPQLTVEVEQPPVDTRPTVKLSGKAGDAAAGGQAKFILNLVWNP